MWYQIFLPLFARKLCFLRVRHTQLTDLVTSFHALLPEAHICIKTTQNIVMSRCCNFCMIFDICATPCADFPLGI